MSPKKVKAKRAFDFSKYSTRRVAFRVAYLGWSYRGVAAQQNVADTVEEHFFNALLKTRLIEAKATCNFSRCGRTDKGVSAMGQVFALTVRSGLTAGPGIIPPAKTLADDETAAASSTSSTAAVAAVAAAAAAKSTENVSEISYCHMLNGALPKDIRVLAWAPVPEPTAEYPFSARFSCTQREYRYYFPLGALNLARMRDGALRLTGDHDYRNFCLPDIQNGVRSFRRKITSFTVEPCDLPGAPSAPLPSSPFAMHQMVICGSGFLYHQVRCMVAVLFMIGEGNEEASLIDAMLDVEQMTGKPSYGMASELPLVLHEAQYAVVDGERVRMLQGDDDGEDVNDATAAAGGAAAAGGGGGARGVSSPLEWQVDAGALQRLEAVSMELWREHALRSTIIASQLALIRSLAPPPQSATSTTTTTGVSHKPMLERGRMGSLDDRIRLLDDDLRQRGLPVPVAGGTKRPASPPSDPDGSTGAVDDSKRHRPD